MSGVRAFRELRVYETAVTLRRRVFEVSKAWPREERYSLTDQIRRSSRSVGANIAEAWSKRRYPRHFVAKLTDAHGEAEETGVWLDTAHECGYLAVPEHHALRALVRATAGGLATMIRQSDQWSGTSGGVRDPGASYDPFLDSPPPHLSTSAPPPLLSVPDHYQDHVRVRVGALLFDDPDAPTAVLLAEHEGIWEDRPFWTPPGGGVEFGESLAEALRREVKEETGLDAEVGAVRYVLDFVRPPLHAVSFYLTCRAPGVADARLGTDPELADDAQLLRDVRMVPFDELSAITLYPEPFAARLAADAQSGFPNGTVYLGTYR